MSEQDIKAKVWREETEKRESIGLKYGQNTESLTFPLKGLSDFAVRTSEEVEVKVTLHSYWKQDKIYINSEYREGENLRILVYEGNHRILLDEKFYATWGIAFTASKGVRYTIRFIDEGSLPKLIAMELTKTASESTFENLASHDQLGILSTRLNRLKEEMKMLGEISEFGILMHENEATHLNHSTCLYMTYLLCEAVVILVIVGLQVSCMAKMLKSGTII